MSIIKLNQLTPADTFLLFKELYDILDEPTIGLDAIAQRQIRYFLKEVNERKRTTILLISHYMEDIKSLCSRSLVIVTTIL